MCRAPTQEIRKLYLSATLALLACGGRSPGEVHEKAAFALAPTSTFVSVYQDALAAGWSDWSWATHSLANPSPVSAGTASVSVTYRGWSGLNLTNPGLRVGGLDFLDLKVDGGASSGAAILARLGLGGGNYGPSIPLGRYCEGGAIPANAFVRCQVPLATLGVTATTPVTALILQEGAGMSLPAMYFDEIGFSAAAKGDTMPPAVTLTAPPADALSGMVQVAATATDDVGVVRGEIYLDGTRVASALTWSWDTTADADGAHLLEARAYDAAGNVGTTGSVSRSVHNSAATRDFAVSITPGQSVPQGGRAEYTISTAETLGMPQPLTLAVSGFLPSGVTASLSRTTVIAGESAVLTVSTSLSTPPAGWPFGVAAAGVYTSRFAGTTLEVLDQTPPTAALTWPLPLQTLSGTATASLSASDNSPAPFGVQDLQLLLDGVSIARAPAWSLAVAFDTTGLVDGPHVLTASAIDASGNVGSAGEQVSVQNSTATRDFGILLSAASVALGENGSTEVAVVTSERMGAPEPLQLAVSAPRGISAALSPSITAGSTATLVLTAATGAESGTLTVAAIGVYTTHVATLAVTVQGQAPTVTLSPEGATVSGTVTLLAIAQDHGGAGMRNVDLLIDGAVVASSPGATASMAWDSTSVTDAPHLFVARATDANGTLQTASTTLTVQNSSTTRDFSVAFAAPSVTVPDGASAALVLNTSQVRGSPETLQVAILGLPFGVNASVSPVHAVAGDPITVTFTAYSYMFPGTIPIVAVATGVYGSHAVTADVRVIDTIPPSPPATVSPPDGAVVAGIIRPSCVFTDNISVAWTSIELDGVRIAANFGIDLDTRTLSDGPHTFVFRAADAAGNAASHVSQVTVLNAPRSHDLVLNGGFERTTAVSPLPAWQTSGSKPPVQSGNAWEGSYALGLGTQTGTGDSIASQLVWIPDGASSAPLVFWYRGQAATGTTDFQEAAVYDQSGALLRQIFHGQISAPWTQASTDLAAFAGRVVELRFSTQGGTGTSLWVDDVGLVVAPDGVGSEAPCRIGGNVLFLDGSPGGIHPGISTITAGNWHSSTFKDWNNEPWLVTIGADAPNWSVEFSLNPLLAGQVGEGATRAPFTRWGPGLYVAFGYGCNEVAGRFQVQEAQYDSGGQPLRFTATFEQSCDDSLLLLRGCVHYEQAAP